MHMETAKKTVVRSSVIFLFLTTVLVLTQNLVSVRAEAVGVKAGDWVKYDVTGNFSGMTNFEWMKIEFTKVEGTNVTVKATVRMTSGTETSQDMSFDIGSSEGGLAGIGFVIPANLDVGDTVSFSGTNIGLTAQTTRTYGGASRTVVGIAYSMPGLVSAAVFWDKATGILLEASMSYGSQSLKIMASSTSFGSDLFGLSWWIWIAIIAAIAAPVGAVAFFLIRRRTLGPPEIAVPSSLST